MRDFRDPSPCLDSWSSWRIREWLDCYPSAPLPANVLSIILTSPKIYINIEAFWPHMIDQNARWKSEFEELKSIGRLNFFRASEPSDSFAYHSDIGNGPEFDDFHSMVYADKEGLIFTGSPQSRSNYEEVQKIVNHYYYERDRNRIKELVARLKGEPPPEDDSTQTGEFQEIITNQ